MHHPISWNIKLAMLATAGLLVGACASEPKAPPRAAMIPAYRPAPAPSAPKNDTGKAGFVNIDRRVVEMCKLPEPHFAFDSAALSPQAKDVLERFIVRD